MSGNNFLQTDTATSGDYAGLYVWSIAANWTQGVPGASGSVTLSGTNADDIATLALTSATLESSDTTTLGGSLSIGTLSIAGGGEIDVSTAYGNAVANLVIGGIVGTGATFKAVGAGATIEVQATTDSGQVYEAAAGGLVLLNSSAVPVTGASSLVFVNLNTGLGDGSVIAFGSLGAPVGNTYDITAQVYDLSAGDALELPIAYVQQIDFGTSSLTIDQGGTFYVFTRLNYQLAQPIGFTQAIDPTTGLLEITFSSTLNDQFQQVATATSGPFAGDYLWSNPANWTGGVPANGGTITLSGSNVDDIGGLSLAAVTAVQGDTTTIAGSLDVGSLTLQAGGALTVLGSTASIGTLDLAPTGTVTVAAGNGSTTADLTIGTVSVPLGSGLPALEASGTGARLEFVAGGSLSGNASIIAQGGTVVFDSNTPGANAYFRPTLIYDNSTGATGNFIFRDPYLVSTANYALNSNLLGGVGNGDALEFPSSYVHQVVLPPNSNVTIIGGLYVMGAGLAGISGREIQYSAGRPFYDTPAPTGFWQRIDPQTGLLQIYFSTAPATAFQQVATDTVGGVTGQYAWSDAANWTGGVPQNGATLSLSAANVDNLPFLSVTEATAAAGDSSSIAGQFITGGLTMAAGATITATTAFGNASADLVIGGLSAEPVSQQLAGPTISALGAGATVELAGTIVEPATVVNTATLQPLTSFVVGNGGTIVFDTPEVQDTTLNGNINFSFDNTAGPGGVFVFKTLDANVSSSSTGLRKYNIQASGVGVVQAGDMFELPVGYVQGVTISEFGFLAGNGQNFGTTPNLGVGSNSTIVNIVSDFVTLSPINGFAQSLDASTGLIRITLTDAAATSFRDAAPGTGGSFDWSNAGNWSNGVPAAGASVTLSAAGLDDIAFLSLTAATLDANATLGIAGTLIVGDVVVGAATAIDVNAGGTLIAGGLALSGATITAQGAAAFADINGNADVGAIYRAGSGGTVELSMAPNAASVFQFLGTGDIAFAAPGTAAIAASLTNVDSGDIIELPGSSVNYVTFGSTTLTIATNIGTYEFSNVSYASTLAGYTASLDAATGLEAVQLQTAPNTGGNILCFVTGTRIATLSGEVAVERLRAGDRVRLADGGTAAVRWVGRTSVAARFADPLRVWPVRIRAGALGPGVPHRDLLVSPGHALLVGNVLAHAGALVNGTSIVREASMPEHFVYWHVELDTHALLLAEGAAAESFLDSYEELAFDNAATRPAPADDLTELPYPRAKSARQVPRAIRADLAARAAALSPPLDEAA